MANLTRMSRSLAGLGAMLGVLVATPGVMAQSTDPAQQPVVDPNAGFSSPDSSGGGLFDDTSGPMDLIHRAVLMNNMSLGEFRQQHQNRMSEEASNFLLLQQQAIRERGASASETPTAVEETPSATATPEVE
jgi:hypothetical protein